MSELLASSALWAALFGLAILLMLYQGVARWVWTLGLVTLLLAFREWGAPHPLTLTVLWTLFLIPAVIFNLGALRRWLISDRLMAFYKAAMPEISRTERDALEAGTVWWDAELFTGRPRWAKLLRMKEPKLSAEEREFLEGPTEELCAMLDDYRITHVDRDLTPETWRFIKERGFFGMIIPREYGGKEMSAYGHASVILKIATRSISAALTVMIPNSVGPGKLLLKYGTEAQKQHYLPRLARGEEVPCFALTAPEAGSDASSIPDTGVVCRQDHDGNKNVLGIRLNFDKRYITLGPVATVLGVAFQLRDPQHLLGERENVGITLALIPAATPGVSIGERHNPNNMAFMNGPVRGTDVFVPMDWVIGGEKQAGKGWRMLMESLTDGRSISLPALSTAAAKISARVTGAYARIRRQFKTPIGLFEGVQESLARIAGNTYAMDAARRVTLMALDAGHKPSVISAIVKYNLTERARHVVNDAIDVHGGAAICLGPRNLLGQVQYFPPVGVTVEGHNILTRNLITFGQGAIRCHPYLLRELNAVSDTDPEVGRRAFDRALTGHIGFAMSNTVRALLLGLTGARLAATPRKAGVMGRYYRQLTRLSSAFAIVSDALLLMLRGELKRRERLSARMADVLSQLYLASATLKHYHDQGQQEADIPLARWACEDALYRAQQSLDILLDNVPYRWVAWLLRRAVFPLGKPYMPPRDDLESAVARVLLAPSSARDRLTAGVYLPDGEGERLNVLESAFAKVCVAEEVEGKLREARKLKLITGRSREEQLAEAVEKRVLTDEQAQSVRAADAARRETIQVDAFGSTAD